MKNIRHSFLLSVFIGLTAVNTSCSSFRTVENNLYIKPLKENTSVEDPSDKRYYLIKNNNEKIYGSKITGKWGDLVKDRISIDDQKFNPKEITAYRNGNLFFHSLSEGSLIFVPRVIHGQLNVYIHNESFYSTSYIQGKSTQTLRWITTYYIQKGEDGNLVQFTSKESILPYIQDCPKAIAMLSITEPELKKAIKANKNYVNEAFETYNNDCRTTTN